MEDCQAEMVLRRNPRGEDMTQTRLRYECPQCHSRMDITTRSNERISYAVIGGAYVGLFAFLLGWIVDLALRSGVHA